MLEGVALDWTQIGAGGIVTLTVLLMFLGRLVPWRYVSEMKERFVIAIAERDALVKESRAERDRWRAIAESLAEQNADLLTNQDLVLEALNSLKAYAAAKEGDQ
jgi:hypothetical protein